MTLVSFVLIVSSTATALASDLSLNIYPRIGKVVYAVTEIKDHITDPININLASKEQYKKLGFEYPSFLAETSVKKLNSRRYLHRSKKEIDKENFVLLFDAQYENFSRLYPYYIETGKGQSRITFGDVIEYNVVAQKQSLPSESDSQLSEVIQIPTRPEFVNGNTFKQVDQQRENNGQIPTNNQVLPQQLNAQPITQPVIQPVQPQIIYSQPPVQYPQPAVLPSQNSSETLPFYTVLIVLALIVFLALCAIGVFIHLSNNSRQHSYITPYQPQKKDEDTSHLTEFMKLLPDLLHGRETPHTVDQQPIERHSVERHSVERQQAGRELPMYHRNNTVSEAQPQAQNVRSDHETVPEHVTQNVPFKSNEEPVQVKKINRPAVQSQPKTQTKPNVVKPAQQQNSKQPQPNLGAMKKRPPSAPVQTWKSSAPLPKSPEPVVKNPISAAENAVPQPSDKSVQKANRPAPPSEKLQLALVYMNMGDEMMARMLLEEIMREGSEHDKDEAQKVLSKLNASNDNSSLIVDKNQE